MCFSGLENGLELEGGAGVDDFAGEGVEYCEGFWNAAAGGAGAGCVEVDGVEALVGFVEGGIAGVDVVCGGV